MGREKLKTLRKAFEEIVWCGGELRKKLTGNILMIVAIKKRNINNVNIYRLLYISGTIIRIYMHIIWYDIYYIIQPKTRRKVQSIA